MCDAVSASVRCRSPTASLYDPNMQGPTGLVLTKECAAVNACHSRRMGSLGVHVLPLGLIPRVLIEHLQSPLAPVGRVWSS